MSDLRRSLAGLAYGSSVYFSYTNDAQDATGRPLAGSTIPPLDPVSPEIVGCLRISTLLLFLKRAFGGGGSAERTTGAVLLTICLLLCPCHSTEPPDWFRAFERADHERPCTRVPRRYADHLADLQRSDRPLMRSVKWGESLFLSGYFAVLKTVNTCRAIFNGKKLSRLCPVPPAVNLVDTRGLVREVLSQLRQQEGNRKGLFVHGGDFRHWFHQISAPGWMRRLFGLVEDGGNEYQWQSVPMGWSWSPVIAQSCAWAVLSFHEAGEAPLLDPEAFKNGRLPTWVNVLDKKGHPIGRATVYYDNYVFLMNDENGLRRVEAIVQRNCREMGAVIKPGSEFSCTAEQMLIDQSSPGTWDEKGFRFLGIHFFGRSESGRGNDLTHLMWRPTKIESWAASMNMDTGKETGDAKRDRPWREWAKMAGQCIFALLMSPDGLRRHPRCRELILATKEIGQSAHTDTWDGRGACTTRLAALEHIWREVQTLQEDPYEASVDLRAKGDTKFRDPTFEHVLFTDASKTGLGWSWVQWQDDAWQDMHARYGCLGRPLDKEAGKEHIFFLELRAALEGLGAWDAEHTDPEARVTLVVDNAALAFALRQGFSSNFKATDMLMEAGRLLDRVEEVILVISEDNPADCCSRNQATDWKTGRSSAESHSATKVPWPGIPPTSEWDARVLRGLRCVLARARGWNWASENRSKWAELEEQSGPRHTAPPDELTEFTRG